MVRKLMLNDTVIGYRSDGSRGLADDVPWIPTVRQLAMYAEEEGMLDAHVMLTAKDGMTYLTLVRED